MDSRIEGIYVLSLQTDGQTDTIHQKSSLHKKANFIT